MNTVKQLVETIKEGIQEKKGQDIVIADLSEMDGTIAKYFVICQGGSPTQVEAIAESVGDMCRKNLGEKPVNVAGLGNDQWVAMDFVDVLVHIFLPEVRAYYDLEHLWADAKLIHVPNLDYHRGAIHYHCIQKNIIYESKQQFKQPGRRKRSKDA